MQLLNQASRLAACLVGVPAARHDCTCCAAAPLIHLPPLPVTLLQLPYSSVLVVAQAHSLQTQVHLVGDVGLPVRVLSRLVLGAAAAARLLAAVCTCAGACPYNCERLPARVSCPRRCLTRLMSW